MIPRHEFKSDEDYIEYLYHYYAGQAMNGLYAAWGNMMYTMQPTFDLIQ